MTKQGTLEAKTLERMNASEQAPSCQDSKVTCEELTLRNCSGENLDVLSKLGSTDNLQTASRWHDRLEGRLGDKCSHTRVNVLDDIGCSSKSKLDSKFPDNQGSIDTVSHGDAADRFNSVDLFDVKEDILCVTKPELLDRNSPKNNCNEGEETGSQLASSNALLSSSCTQTKILAKSGITKYFVKDTLKDEGILCRETASCGEFHDQSNPEASSPNKVDTSAPLNSNRGVVLQVDARRHQNVSRDIVRLHYDGVSLRELIGFRENKRNKVKSLHIFKQIVEAVSDSHTKGIVMLDLRPSYFKLLQSNEFKYIGSNVQMGNFNNQDTHDKPNYQNENRPTEYSNIPNAKRIKLGGNPKLVISEPHSPNKSGSANGNNVRYGGPQYTGNELCDIFYPKPVDVTESDSSGMHMSNSSKLVFGSANNKSEEVKWYASPEELNERQCILSSNIYSLGILLFEMLCSFDSERCRDIAMLNLRNSILPPDFLAENPREAGLCLWLLHPESSLRPSIREILESDVIKEIEDLSNVSSSSKHDDIESDLLLYFLESVKQKKHDRSSKLMEEIKLLEADIEEVEKRRRRMSLLPEDSFHARGEVSLQSSSRVMCDTSTPFCNEQRLMKNINQLEKVYFSLRSTVDSSNNGPFSCDVKELFNCQETSCYAKKDGELKKSTDSLGVFNNGLCKYARYTKFKVCGTLRNATIHNSNIVSSLSFDPNEDYFAAAGVSKKIKIYDFHAVLNNNVDIQYPLIELSNRSKFSCTSWNHYIQNCLASSDYDGVVKLWDVGTGKEVNQYTEHSTRAWSVDFSPVRPTSLASTSDDHCLKLWDINQKSSVMTVGNVKSLCCVKFSGKSSNLLAYGSADNITYCIDLRFAKNPWCLLVGHAAIVSHVNFLDSETIISASIDNTLKIWDLKKTSDQACISTLRGHTNEKRFVGLSVTNDGYIMCGSETNEVFAYHRFLSMPITSHKFDLVNPITGKETDDDNGDFVSSVCSRKESELVVAANSAGSIKVLQMV